MTVKKKKKKRVTMLVMQRLMRIGLTKKRTSKRWRKAGSGVSG